MENRTGRRRHRRKSGVLKVNYHMPKGYTNYLALFSKLYIHIVDEEENARKLI